MKAPEVVPGMVARVTEAVNLWTTPGDDAYDVVAGLVPGVLVLVLTHPGADPYGLRVRVVTPHGVGWATFNHMSPI